MPQVLVNSVVLARLIAQESDMLVPGTAAMLADDVAAGRLVRLECSAPAMQTNNGVLYLRERTLSPAARVFIEALRQVEAEAQAADATCGRRQGRGSRRAVDLAGDEGGAAGAKAARAGHRRAMKAVPALPSRTMRDTRRRSDPWPNCMASTRG